MRKFVCARKPRALEDETIMGGTSEKKEMRINTEGAETQSSEGHREDRNP